MKLKAIKPVWYAGKEHRPGDEFDCIEPNTIKIWTAHDLPGGPIASIAEAVASEPPRTVPQPAPVRTAEDQTSASDRRRYYRRRDMTAEE